MPMKRTVTFWQCFTAGTRSAEVWPQEGYLDTIRTFGEMDGADRIIDDVCYVVHPGSNGLSLSMHKPIDRDFLTSIDWSAGTIIEASGDEKADSNFANSTVVQFYPKYGALALSRVNNSSPRKKAILALLERCFPTEQGMHWMMRPVMDKTALDLFLNHSRGITTLTTSFSTLKQLGLEAKGVATYGDQLASKIDAELDIELTLTLNARRAATMGPRERLREALRVDLPRLLSSKDNGTQVTALLDNGTTQVLDLVEQKLSVQEEITDEVAASEARLFNELLSIVKRVSGMWEDRIYQMLEG